MIRVRVWFQQYPASTKDQLVLQQNQTDGLGKACALVPPGPVMKGFLWQLVPENSENRSASDCALFLEEPVCLYIVDRRFINRLWNLKFASACACI